MRTRGEVLKAPLVSAWSVLALLLGLSIPAAAQEAKDQVLPGCGICYPGGYDANTVGEVAGRVAEIVVPEDGPVRLVVTTEEERWTVLASPAWFWKKTDLRLVPGDQVTVRGSKSLGADGKLYIVAQAVRRADGAAAALLRDGRGAPLWRGNRSENGMRGGGRGRR